jgi:L-methionine (R)-S-oxide reductase
MGDESLMRKADLLDELRAEVGVVSDKMSGSVHDLYRFVTRTLHNKMESYHYTGIYLVSGWYFRRFCESGRSPFPPAVRFGEGLHSLAAARGGIVREQLSDETHVFVPFYRGHHLVGELIVIGDISGLDDEDVAFFRELASLFETKMRELNS